MQTRKANQVHMLDEDVCDLHFRPNKFYEQDLGFIRPVVVELAMTTKKVVIGRVSIYGHRKSPWFELKNEDIEEEAEKLADWWMSGAALANIMLR